MASIHQQSQLNGLWQSLPYAKWKSTLDTLHMWLEIVGKVKLELSPFLNQWWEVAFYITATGMTTGKIPYRGELFQVDFNFLNHMLTINTSWRKTKALPLISQSVAEFYEVFMTALKDVGIQVAIWPVPVEVEHPILFDKDIKHKMYEKEYVECWWHILVKVNIVFEQFRTSFCGKSSPIQFFWGSFDLAGTRFSGRKAKPHKMQGTMAKIMRYAENEENFAFGFWPGDERFPYPAFYTYMYPQPKGSNTIKLDSGASFNEQLGEYILSYDVVRKAKNPSKLLSNYLISCYRETAKLASWDIKFFQSEIPTIS